MTVERARPALVSTVRGTGPAIRDFVGHHLRIGFDRILLFFDDPDDPSIAYVPDDARVSAIPCDDEVRSCWADWPEVQRLVETEVMARQMLNAELALHLARADGQDWLVHLDGDELLDHDGDLGDYLAETAHRGIDQVRFWNWEAVPERVDLRDPFREVTLFKRNPSTYPDGGLDATQRALIERVDQIPPQLFHYYKNGKSAVRIQPGVRPHGCHGFERVDGELSSHATSDPRVLHYANPGFDAFWKRYRMWGAFADVWFGDVSIRDRIGDLHLDARDVVATGDVDAARALYRRRVVIDDGALAEELVASGICQRITGPSAALGAKDVS